MSCTRRHSRDDAQLGLPFCADCYDYTGTVLFNAHAPELWRRFTITLRRALARQAGMTVKTMSAQVRISYAKVAEYQRRGVVHFHAIVRLDGPDGPTARPPTWATADLLTTSITQALRTVRVGTPAAVSLPARTIGWGREHDVRPITATGELTDTKVARYVAKYATKAAECTGTLDRRITPADRLATLPVTSHARRLITECLRLGQLPELADLRLTAWAHMLGFRGHFSTKSRRYSTTLGALRAARAEHQRQDAITAGLRPDPASFPGTVLVLATWNFHGRGHPPAHEPRYGGITPAPARHQPEEVSTDGRSSLHRGRNRSSPPGQPVDGLQPHPRQPAPHHQDRPPPTRPARRARRVRRTARKGSDVMTRGRQRANGEGSIFPYRNGYAAYVWVTTPDGIRRRKWAYGKTREETHGKWLKLHEAARRGAVATSSPTLADYLSYWLREVAA